MRVIRRSDSVATAPLILESPRSRSTNSIGTSTHLQPAPEARGDHVGLEDVAGRLAPSRGRSSPACRAGTAGSPPWRRGPGSRAAAARRGCRRARAPPGAAASSRSSRRGPSATRSPGRPAASASSRRCSCSGWCEPSASISPITSYPASSATRTRARTPPRGRPSRSGARRGRARSAAASSSAIPPVPSGDPSSTTRTSTSGWAARSRPHDPGEVVGLVVGRDRPSRRGRGRRVMPCSRSWSRARAAGRVGGLGGAASAATTATAEQREDRHPSRRARPRPDPDRRGER